jgi:ribonucleoside-diphosphate reductase alpha chain
MGSPHRTRLPVERQSITRTFRIRYKHKDGTDDIMHIYITAGAFSDGRPGEVFIKADRMGTMARGALDATATMISLLLQYGVPLEVVTGKLRNTRYEPAGFTGDDEFKTCTSVLDLVAQWLDKRFGETAGAP